MQVSHSSNAYRNVAFVLAGLGVLLALFPQLLGPLMPAVEQYPDTPISIPETIARFGRGLAFCMLLWAGYAFWRSSAEVDEGSSGSMLITLLTILGSYLALAWTVGMWMVDDAAISFAYTENLVRGYGLVLHPNLPSEEAYSNTSWVLLLAIPRWLGMDLIIAGKLFGLLLGAGAISIAVWLTIKNADTELGLANTLLLAVLVVGAPFVVWSGSGLETSIHAILFMCVVYGAHRGDTRGIWITALSFGGLILTRPEIPLIVGTVGLAWFLYVWRNESFLAGFRLWPIGVVPLVVAAGLTVFRYTYFGDPLPNPYYGKGPSLTLGHLMWGGWYGFRWMLGSFAFMLIPFIVFFRPRQWALVAFVAVGILVGQFGFLIYSSGDWMRCFRFIAPVLPVLGFVVVYANLQSGKLSPRIAQLTLIVVPVLVLGMSRQLVEFNLNPTTPITRVGAQGITLADVSERLGIEAPTVAHHDAGGISYIGRLELVDLAGLGNRYVGKNKRNRELMRQYLLIDRKPDFVMGSSVNPGFAAGATRFYEDEIFVQDYVYIEFPGRYYMQAEQGPDPLSHIRREHIKDVPGIEPVYENGQLVKVVVSPPAEPVSIYKKPDTQG